MAPSQVICMNYTISTWIIEILLRLRLSREGIQITVSGSKEKMRLYSKFKYLRLGKLIFYRADKILGYLLLPISNWTRTEIESISNLPLLNFESIEVHIQFSPLEAG